MCNLTMKYPHEEEIAELKAEIERLRNVIEESNRSTQMYRRRLDDLDRQYSKHKNEWYKADHEQRAEIERLKCEKDKLAVCVIDLINVGRNYQSRAAAWKRCALMWRDDYEIAWRTLSGNDRVDDDFPAHRFERFDGKLDTSDWATTTIDKAPPDWREKWIPSSPEDKSALDKKTGSLEP